MKTIGVLGGLGPQATDDFVVRVHREANRLIEPRFNTGYPPMVVHYHRRPPVVMADARSPRLPLEVDRAILPLMLHEEGAGPINPADLLAVAAVERAARG